MSGTESFTQSKPVKGREINGNGSVTLQSQENIAQGKWSSLNTVAKLYAVSDVMSLSLGLIIASFAASDDMQIISFLLVSAGILVWLASRGHYRIRMPFWTEFKQIVNVMALGLLVDSFLQFTYNLDSSRFLVIAGWVFTAFAMVSFRMVVRNVAVKQGISQIPTLLIGAGTTAQHALAAIESAPEIGYKLVAQIKNLPEVFLQHGSSWSYLCEDYGVQHVIIAIEDKELHGADKIITKLVREDISFSVVPPLSNIPVTNMVPQYFMNHNTLLLTHDSGYNQYFPVMVKRVLDVLVSGTALLLLSPVMLVIAALIKLDGGAAFFGHKRIGRDGKVFPCLKFRSMVVDGDRVIKKYLEENKEAAEEWKATQKLKNDPRVTRIGKFLRGTSLDELPQLINVLKGDMSLVGPRPIVREEVAHYNHDIAYYYRVRPGVTGLWQVSGRNDVTYAQRVQMDSWYVRNWSLWHDIAIIFKTFPAVLKRSGAY